MASKRGQRGRFEPKRPALIPPGGDDRQAVVEESAPGGDNPGSDVPHAAGDGFGVAMTAERMERFLEHRDHVMRMARIGRVAMQVLPGLVSNRDRGTLSNVDGTGRTVAQTVATAAFDIAVAWEEELRRRTGAYVADVLAALGPEGEKVEASDD